MCVILTFNLCSCQKNTLSEKEMELIKNHAYSLLVSRTFNLTWKMSKKSRQIDENCYKLVMENSKGNYIVFTYQLPIDDKLTCKITNINGEFATLEDYGISFQRDTGDK